MGGSNLMQMKRASQNILAKFVRPILQPNKFLWTQFSSPAPGQDYEVQLYSERRLLGYSKEQMFKVVSEVENYHKFVPWCKESNVVYRDKHRLEADLVVGFPPIFGESYRSCVSLFAPNLVTAISTDLKLFRHLKSVWKFDDNNEDVVVGMDKSKTCLVDFAVSFQFRNQVHSSISKLFFDEVIRQNVKSFLTEAERQFGLESIERQNPKIYAKS